MRFEAEIEKVHISYVWSEFGYNTLSGLHGALPASAHIKAWFSKTGDFFYKTNNMGC